MKELLLRLRHWLIKKLGGFTEQHVYAPRNDYHVISLCSIKVQAECRVDLHFLQGCGSEQSVYDGAMERLASELSREISSSEFSLVTCMDEPETASRIYRASVLLIPPTTAAKLNL